MHLDDLLRDREPEPGAGLGAWDGIAALLKALENLLTLVVRSGLGAFLGLLVALAFAEELLWDRLVWHERGWLFGNGAALGENLLAWVVPLLAVPQLTHYVLDGFLWRRGETRRLGAQRAALGFEGGGGRERLVEFRV